MFLIKKQMKYTDVFQANSERKFCLEQHNKWTKIIVKINCGFSCN